jgi:hypothetical protein
MPTVEHGDCRNEAELLALRRTTFQIPLPSIQDCKYHPVDLNMACIRITSRDSSTAEFVVRRKATSRRRKGLLQHGEQTDADMLTEAQKRLNYRSWRTGLQTDELLPSVWCSRVVDEIGWRLREDVMWIKWARALRVTLETDMMPPAELEADNERESSRKRASTMSMRSSCLSSIMPSVTWRQQWINETISYPSVLDDFHRLQVELENPGVSPQDSDDESTNKDWFISTLNVNYELCDTYPQYLVFPNSLSEDVIRRAATERSKERLPTLVWIHPINRVPLCRSAQPLAGLAKLPEADKRLCLAIKAACPTGLPLRIADARPYINAQANAIQGKGYENIAFLGGPNVAQLFFLDIHNVPNFAHLFSSKF